MLLFYIYIYKADDVISGIFIIINIIIISVLSTSLWYLYVFLACQDYLIDSILYQSLRSGKLQWWI